MNAASQEALDRVYPQLEAAAVAGKRCPENGQLGGNSSAVPDLARAGKIMIEIYAHNWRRVTILTGSNAGKATLPHPNAAIKPWKTIDANGTHTTRNKVPADVGPRSSRRQPSAPRPLTREEMDF